MGKCICTHKEHVLFAKSPASSSLFIRVVRDGLGTSDKCLLSEPSVWHQSREKKQGEREQREE